MCPNNALILWEEVMQIFTTETQSHRIKEMAFRVDFSVTLCLCGGPQWLFYVSLITRSPLQHPLRSLQMVRGFSPTISLILLPSGRANVCIARSALILIPSTVSPAQRFSTEYGPPSKNGILGMSL